MNDPVFVDARVPAVLPDGGDTALFRSTDGERWLYRSRQVRPALGANGAPLLTLVRKRQRQAAEAAGAQTLVTQGAVIAGLVHLVPLPPSPAEEQAWVDAVRRSGTVPPGGGQLDLAPLPVWRGSLTVGGLDALGVDPAPYQDVPIGTPLSAPVCVRFGPEGADALWDELAHGQGLPAVVRVDYHYELAFPDCAYRLTASAGAVRAVLAGHPEAVAGLYGTAGGQAEQDALYAELRTSGAASFTWDRAPAGLDDAQLASAETAVIQRWAKRAADRLVASVEPDPDAQSAGHDLGIVRVRLRSPAETAGMDLSETHDGERVARQPWTQTINLGQLRDLPPGADVIGDATVPVALGFGADERVDRFICNLGYRKPDGTTVASSHEGAGSMGLNRVDEIRWDAGEPRPQHVEVQFAVVWQNPSWAAQTVAASLTVDDCLAIAVSPAAYIAEVALVSDLALAPPGSLAAVSWNVQTPRADGGTVRYSGSFFLDGAGDAGEPAHEVATFPFMPGQEPNTVFTWNADLTMPDGTVLSGQETFSLAQKTESDVFRADLRPT